MHKFLSVALCIALAAMHAGCGQRRPLAPVQGRVLYNGQPLRFGGVSFQPASGQPSQGAIAEDGAFELATRGEGKGAVVGTNRVRITCYESQDPQYQTRVTGEAAIGRSLIPAKYNSYETSGLVVEVAPDQNETIVFHLTDRN